MRYELLQTIKRKEYFGKNKIWDRGLSAEYDLIKYLIEQNLKWNEKDFQISALDYLAFKELEYSYLDRDWYISNFVVKTTENEYQVFCRYKKFSKEGK